VHASGQPERGRGVDDLLNDARSKPFLLTVKGIPELNKCVPRTSEGKPRVLFEKPHTVAIGFSSRPADLVAVTSMVLSHGRPGVSAHWYSDIDQQVGEPGVAQTNLRGSGEPARRSCVDTPGDSELVVGIDTPCQNAVSLASLVKPRTGELLLVPRGIPADHVEPSPTPPSSCAPAPRTASTPLSPGPG
jgi:hypothetical protein